MQAIWISSERLCCLLVYICTPLCCWHWLKILFAIISPYNSRDCYFTAYQKFAETSVLISMCVYIYIYIRYIFTDEFPMYSYIILIKTMQWLEE